MPIPALLKAAATAASTAANAQQAIRGGADMFSKWFPSLDLIGEVELQGEKTTTSKATLHQALAIAFGMVDTTKLAEIELHTEFDHVNNRVHVAFGVSNAALLFMLNSLLNSAGGAAVNAAGGGIFSMVAPVPALGAAWYGARNGANNKDKADNLITQVQELVKRLPTSKIWDTPKDDIIGGPIPMILQDFVERHPMNETKSQLFLTRSDAINPQPPGSDGLDLRSLVAQVLHDPGVRPPMPRTNAGPPVQDEASTP